MSHISYYYVDDTDDYTYKHQLERRIAFLQSQHKRVDDLVDGLEQTLPNLTHEMLLKEAKCNRLRIKDELNHYLKELEFLE